MLVNVLIAGGLLVIVMGAVLLINHLKNPYIETPDGQARLEGQCGCKDSMEIAFKLENGRITQISQWANGCGCSVNCINAAADLAQNKTLEELSAINADLIQKTVGGLPKDQRHCAELAANTLKASLKNYYSRTEIL